MPIAAHAQAGQLLKSVLAVSYCRKGVYNRVNSVRSELDDWVQCEYNRTELPNEEFFDLYYHGADKTFPRSLPDLERARHVESLRSVTQLVTEHYPDCPPLRSLRRKVDAAIESLLCWDAQRHIAD
jgi:hypothetical protein